MEAELRSLENIANKRATGKEWRDHASHFKQQMDGPFKWKPGCIDLSPGYYARGQVWLHQIPFNQILCLTVIIGWEKTDLYSLLKPTTQAKPLRTFFCQQHKGGGGMVQYLPFYCPSAAVCPFPAGSYSKYGRKPSIEDRL